jgi:hypothetical protein
MRLPFAISRIGCAVSCGFGAGDSVLLRVALHDGFKLLDCCVGNLKCGFIMVNAYNVAIFLDEKSARSFHEGRTGALRDFVPFFSSWPIPQDYPDRAMEGRSTRQCLIR